MHVMGLKDLQRNFTRIRSAMVHPQSGFVECMDRGANEWIIPDARRRVWQLFNTSGDFPSRIQTKKINQFRLDIVVNAVYGAIHEYGGTFTITGKQRIFFWAMWYKTGDEMWKALALSTTYTIPARPYLRPALDRNRNYAMAVAASCLAFKMKKAVK